MADQTIEVSVDESAGSLTEYFPAHADRYGGGTTQIYSVDGTATNGKEFTFTPTSGYNSGGHGHLEIKYPATVQLNPNTFAGSSKDFDLVGVAPNGFTLDYHVTINPDRYSLHFNFKQGVDANGNIKPGSLTATLMDDTTGDSVYSITKAASCDDAFPLKTVANEAAIDDPETRADGKLGLRFNIDGFARGTDQTDVELHVGSPQLSPVSADSESCLVVSQKNFLTPLEQQIAKVAGIDAANVSTSQELSDWINQNLPVTLSTKVGMSQPTLSLKQGDSDGQFSFHLSRPIEKDVAVIYSVVGANGKVLSTREAIVGAGTQDTDDIDVADLRKSQKQPIAKSTFSDLPGISNAAYNGSFGKAANLPAGSQFSVKIDGYAVHLQNANNDLWYWDSKQSGRSSMVNEKLMLSGAGSRKPVTLTAPDGNGPPALSARTSDAPTEPFLFTADAGQGSASNLIASGAQHSVVQVPSAEFQNLAQAFANPQDCHAGSVSIADPANGNSLQIPGVTKAGLQADKQDHSIM